MTGGALIRFGKISFFSQGTGALKYEATVTRSGVKLCMDINVKTRTI
jgi:hypothetical protein